MHGLPACCLAASASPAHLAASCLHNQPLLTHKIVMHRWALWLQLGHLLARHRVLRVGLTGLPLPQVAAWPLGPHLSIQGMDGKEQGPLLC